MKFSPKTAVIVLLSLIVISMLVLVSLIINYNKNLNSRIDPLPEFCLTGYDGITINLKEVPSRNLLLIFYKSDCPFSKAFVKDLSANINKFRNTRVLLISPEIFEATLPFLQYVEIGKIVPGQDIEAATFHVFNVRRFPTLLLYNSDYQLIKRYNGAVPIQEIIECLK